MNKPLLITIAMFFVTTIFIAVIAGDAITGFAFGWILGIATFVFFEYVYYDDEKKTAKHDNA